MAETPFEPFTAGSLKGENPILTSKRTTNTLGIVVEETISPTFTPAQDNSQRNFVIKQTLLAILLILGGKGLLGAVAEERNQHDKKVCEAISAGEDLTQIQFPKVFGVIPFLEKATLPQQNGIDQLILDCRRQTGVEITKGCAAKSIIDSVDSGAEVIKPRLVADAMNEREPCDKD
jgi:hypothetical protein